MTQDCQEPEGPSLWKIIFRVLLFMVLGVVLVVLLLFGVCVASVKF